MCIFRKVTPRPGRATLAYGISPVLARRQKFLITTLKRNKEMEPRSIKFIDTATPQKLQQIAKARELTRQYYLTDYFDTKTKSEILKQLFNRIGANVSLDSPFYCNFGKNISIGENVIIGMNCTVVDDSSISIGNNVMIASNVQIYTATHPVEADERLDKDWKAKRSTFFKTYALPVVIEDNVWIGGGVIILPDVTIGKNSVIGAGSVVTKSIPSDSVAVGSPCKVMRSLRSATI